MPLKTRHLFQNIGALPIGNSPAIHVPEATSAVFSFTSAAGTSVVNFEYSPDGGVGFPWVPFYHLDTATQAWIKVPAFTVPVPGGAVVLHVPLPGFLRLVVTVEDVTGAWIEGIREIV